MRSLSVLLFAVSACSIDLPAYPPDPSSSDAGVVAIRIEGPASLDIFSTATLTAQCEYSSGPGACPPLVWRSSEPAIASVDAFGGVTALRTGDSRFIAANGLVQSEPHALSVRNPVPEITAIAPLSAVVGSGALVLTVSGTGLLPDSSVSFDGVRVPIVSSGPGSIRVQVPATSLQTAAVVQVVVENAAPGGGVSRHAWFTIANAPPELHAITPEAIVAGDDFALLSFQGAGFLDGAVLLVNSLARPVELADSTSGTARIEVNELIAPTVLQISVRNPGAGARPSNPLPLTVRLGAMPSFTPHRARFGAAISGDYLYVVGGRGVRPDDGAVVSFTRIRANGTLEPWRNTTPLSVGVRVDPAVVAHLGRLYVIGGGDNIGVAFDEILSAEVLPNGELSAWTQIETLPEPRTKHAAVIHGDRLFILGGMTSGPEASVIISSFRANGSITPPMIAPGMNPTLGQARRSHSGVGLSDRLLVFGGDDASTTLSSAESAPIAGLEDVGPWRAVDALPERLRGIAAAAQDANVFALGGARDFATQDSIAEGWSARMDLQSGALREGWRALGAFDVARSGAGALVHGPYLYLLGGYSAGARGYLGDVQRARITADGLLDGGWSPLSFRVPFEPDAACRLLLAFEGSTDNACGAGSGFFGGAEYASEPSIMGAKIRATGTSEESGIETQLRVVLPPSATIEMTIQSFGDAFEGRDRGVLYSDIDAILDPLLTRGVQIYVYNDGRVGITTRDGAGAGTTIETTSAIIDPGGQQYQHVKVTIDAATGIRLYVDGAEVLLDPSADLPPRWAASNDTGWIGAARESDEGAIYRFNGSFDQVRISDVIR